MQVTESMIRAYLTTALWSSTGDDGNPLDGDYDSSDCDDSVITQSREDIQSFLDYCGDKLIEEALEYQGMDRIMHDLWLTRNGHGAGFWDGGYNGYKSKLANKLTESAKILGGCDLYVGDDGKIYLA